MYRVSNFIIRPFMRLWHLAAAATWYDIPRPLDAASAHSSGTNPIRMLLLGSGPVVGYGVLTHDLALPGNLARMLASSTGRGVDVDVVADGAMTANSALASIEPVRLSRYDAVIVLVGVNDALDLTPVSSWRRDIDALLSRLESEGGAELRIFLATISRLPRIRMLRFLPSWIANRHSARLNEALPLICAEHPSTVVVEFHQAPSREASRHRSPETYRMWANDIVGPIAAALAADTRRGSTLPDQDENDRQSAVEELSVLDTEPDERFSRVAAVAQQLFGTAGSAITFIDGDRQWFKARRGFSMTETARDISFCDHTIRRNEAFVVPNTMLDARFRDNPLVTGEHHLRFYAGYPIEAPDGHRVGALCLLDTESRDFSAADAVLLRDLALIVQDLLRENQTERVLS